MKTITNEQIEAILQLLQKYNVGIQEYGAVVQMFEKLPSSDKVEKVEKENKEENKQ